MGELNPVRTQAFLSHNSRDRVEVRLLMESLEEAGVRCWLDERELNPGDDVDPVLARAMEASSCFVYIVGRYGPGDYQLREVYHWFERVEAATVVDRRRSFALFLPGADLAKELRRLPHWLTKKIYPQLERVPPTGTSLAALKAGMLGGNRREAAPAAASTVVPDDGMPPEDLPLLCDRDDQEEVLKPELETRAAMDEKWKRPRWITVQGLEEQAPMAYVRRLATHDFKGWLAEWGLAGAHAGVGGIRLLPLPKLPASQGPPEAFAASYRGKIREALNCQRPCRNDAELIDCLVEAGIGLAMPALALTLEEVFRPSGPSYLERVGEYWRQFPDLDGRVRIVAFVIVRRPATLGARRWLSERLGWGDAGRLHSWIEAARKSERGPSSPAVLPDLADVERGHVARWAEREDVRPRLVEDLSGRLLTEVFGNRDRIPMEEAIGRLRRVLLRKG